MRCTHHNELTEDIKEIKRDVKELLGLKYKIVGAITVISFMATFVINFLIKKIA